jgi:hypothetical protein
VNIVLGVVFLTLPALGDLVDLVFTYFAYRTDPAYWFMNEAAFSFKMDVMTHGYFTAAINAMIHNATVVSPLLAACVFSICAAHLLKYRRAETLCLIVAVIASGLIFALHVYGGLSWSMSY